MLVQILPEFCRGAANIRHFSLEPMPPVRAGPEPPGGARGAAPLAHRHVARSWQDASVQTQKRVPSRQPPFLYPGLVQDISRSSQRTETRLGDPGDVVSCRSSDAMIFSRCAASN